MVIDVVSKKVQLGGTEEALVGVDDNAVSGEAFENSSQIGKVLFGRGAGDEYIVDVCICSRNSTEDLVHEALERLSGVPETERHLHKLKQSEWSCDGGLGYVCRVHWDLVVRTHEIQFGEDSGTL